MGNSASALPYNIGDETHPSTRPGSYGFAIHNGNRKSDNLPVTVFKASKSSLAQTPLVKGSNAHDATLTQIFPALHHFQKTKTLIHPNILKVYATLDTDFPNEGKDSSSTAAASSSKSYSSSSSKSQLQQINTDRVNPASLSALEQTPTTGALIIITEPVVPLPDYLEALQNDTSLTNQQRSDAIGYGIHNLIQALTFLHQNAKVAHGNIGPHAIYVTPSGDFKLSSLQLLTPIGIADGVSGPTPHFRHFERDVTPNLFRSPERIEGRWDAISTSPVHVMDAYSMGVFLPELYNHLGAGTNGKLPLKFDKACRRLASQSLSARPRVGPLVRCPVLDTEYIKAQSFLDTLATQDVEAKIIFWKSLPDLLTNKKILSYRVAKYKILPLLQSAIVHLTSIDVGLTQDVHKRECLALLPTLFSTSTNYLSQEEFQSQISPVIELLFRVNDRAVRGALLSRISLFAKLLDGPTLNRIVFEPMCSGFSDSSAPMRELTLKSAIVVVEHLTPANLEKLTRYLVRLQNDAEDSIRTNTVIFIGKVAPNLSDMARSKLILPAFMRAMRDTFVPCRLAGLKAIRACRGFFDEENLAKDVLPAIAPSLVDGNEEVRHESMRVVEELLETLRSVGERMSEEQRTRVMMEASENTSAGNGVGGAASTQATSTTSLSSALPTSSSSSYLSGFGLWSSSKTPSSTSATTAPLHANSVNQPKAPSTTCQQSSTMLSSTSVPPPKPAPKFSSLSLQDAGVGGNNGWSNDDDHDFAGLDNNVIKPTTTNKSNNSLIPAWASEKDDDFMSQFDTKDFIRPRSAVGVGGSRLDTPSRVAASSRRRAELEQKKIKEKIRVTKLTMDSGLDDGWDDF
jgi:SCY1-like protein 1